MPVPTNLTSGTALDLGSLPIDYTQDVNDGGTTYDVWYSFVSPVSGAIGVQAFGDGSYTPEARTYHSGDLVNKLADSPPNGPSQMIVEEGETYFIHVVFSGDVTPSVVHLSVVAFEASEWPKGSFLIPDDGDSDDGYPAVVLSAVTDFLVHAFPSHLPSGEQGDCADNGNILLEDTTGQSLVLFDRFLTVLSTIPGFIVPRIRTNRGTDSFWISENQSGITWIHKVHKLSPDGAFGPTEWTIDAEQGAIEGLCPSLDESVLYYCEVGAGQQVRRWNLATDSAASDFATGITGYRPIDILVLFDETVVVSFWHPSTTDTKVRRYSPNGVLLNTYEMGLSDGSSPWPRMSSSVDNLTSFWIWMHVAVDGGQQSRMFQVRASDGEIMRTVNHAEFQTGGALGPPVDDAPRFGTPISCPLIVLRWPEIVIDESLPCCETSCDCPPGGGGGTTGTPSTGSPSSEPIPSSTGPILPPERPIGPLDILSEPYWEVSCEGGGLVPFAADPVDVESWVH